MHIVQSKACAGGLYVDHPGYSLVAQVGSRCASARCLSLSCLTTVASHRYARTRPVLPWALPCGASEWALPCGASEDRFSLGNGITSAVASAVCTGRGIQPWPPEKCDPRQWWETALTIATLRAAKRASTRLRGPERRLRARIQCPRQRPQPGAYPFPAESHARALFNSFVHACIYVYMPVYTTENCTRNYRRE